MNPFSQSRFLWAVSCVTLCIFTSGCKEQTEYMPEPAIVGINIVNRAIDPATFTLEENQKVSLGISSDENGELHIAVLEHLISVTVGEQTSFSFTAQIPGRFPIEWHPEGNGHDHDHHEQHDIPLGYFIVQPR